MSYFDLEVTYSSRDEHCDCCGRTIGRGTGHFEVPCFYGTYIICDDCPADDRVAEIEEEAS